MQVSSINSYTFLLYFLAANSLRSLHMTITLRYLFPNKEEKNNIVFPLARVIKICFGQLDHFGEPFLYWNGKQ